MSRVPEEWSRILAGLDAAQVAWAAMRAPGTPQVARDTATDAYCRAVDQMVEDLGRLRERHVLTRITLFLSRQVR